MHKGDELGIHSFDHKLVKTHLQIKEILESRWEARTERLGLHNYLDYRNLIIKHILTIIILNTCQAFLRTGKQTTEADMKNRRNYYRLLQVQPDAPLEVIRASYRTLMNQLGKHPDHGGEHWEAAVLNEAYATLTNPEKRAEYDKQLFEHYTKKPFGMQSANKQPRIKFYCPFCKRPLARKSEPHENCSTCKSPLHSDAHRTSERCRRSVARIKKSGKLRYYSDWPQKAREAEIVDLSPKGVRFTCCESLKPGTTVKISSAFLKGIVKIVNCQKRARPGRSSYIIGAQFLTVQLAEPKGSFFSASA